MSITSSAANIKNMKTRIDLLNWLKLKKVVYERVKCPMSIHLSLTSFVTQCAINRIKLSNLTSFIYNMGYLLFESCFKIHGIYSIYQMEMVAKYINIALPEIIQYEPKGWFLNADSLPFLVRECKKHDVDIDAFIEFVTDNKEEIIGQGHLFTKNKLEAALAAYLQSIV